MSSPRMKSFEKVGMRKLELKPSINHPLQSKIVKISSIGASSSNESSSGCERFGEKKAVEASTSWGGIDPLSAALQDYDEMHSDRLSPVKTLPSSRVFEDFQDENFRCWNAHKIAILKEYTTSERLSIKTSFLSGGDAAGGSSISVRNLQNTSLAEKVKHRLQQLDDFEESSVKEMFGLTQQEYVNRIEDLNRALKDSWESDQRVKALKISIQCVKLLVDISVIQFYPSKFVLITDMLDNFGKLVYNRISCKAESRSALESAQETCRNWFYKIASIRELIPRLYVEAAILKTLSFIIDEKQVYSENCKALHRITSMVRGIGDPLVAIFARAYICRIAIRITPYDKSIFHQNFSDFLLTSRQMESDFVLFSLSSQKVSYKNYLTLYIPALNWILQCLIHKTSDTAIMDIIDEYKRFTHDRDQVSVSALVLNSLLTVLDAEFIAERGKEFVELVVDIVNKIDERAAGEGTQQCFPFNLLLKNLGQAFAFAERAWNGVEKKDKMILMNEIWKKVSKLKSSDHISCASVWIDFVVKYLGVKEVNVLLKDVLKHIQPDRAYEEHYEEVLTIVKKITRFSSLDDFAAFFALDTFVPFLDMLQKESVKVEACKIIVNAYLEKLQERNSRNQSNNESSDHEWIVDPVVLNSLTYLCKTLHDSVNALSLEDDKRQISDLVIGFITQVSFHRDFQSHLDFLVNSRSNFSNLEPVIAYLVTCVNKISMETCRIIKGHHTKKTMTFTRACLAYSYITIPSLDDAMLKLQLYLNSAEIALLNGCLPQTDAFLKALIETLPSVNLKVELSDGRIRSLEPFFVTLIADTLSFLLIVPDHPEKESLHLFRDLFSTVKNLEFDQNSDTRAFLFLDMVNYLCSAAQENYQYHIDRVDSNDVLYGHDSKFLKAIDELRDEVVQEILSYLKALGERTLFKRQSMIAFDCFFRLVFHGDMKKVGKLVFNLWQLVMRNNSLDTKNLTKSINFVAKLAQSSCNDELLILSKKMASLLV